MGQPPILYREIGVGGRLMKKEKETNKRRESEYEATQSNEADKQAKTKE